MLRCLRYEFGKIFSRKLIPVLWLALLVLNGVLFTIQKAKENQSYFENLEFSAIQEAHYNALPETRRQEELDKLKRNASPLSWIGMLYTWGRDDELIQTEIDVYSEEYPELKQILKKIEDPTKINRICAYAEEYQKKMNWPREYTEYVRYVQEEAERMSQISIFNKKHSFAANNIHKTAEDFQPCLNVQPGIGNEKFFEEFHSWHIGDLLSIFLILMTSAALFLKEQENNMVYLIHSAPNGRIVTSCAKLITGLLLLTAVIISFTGEELLLTGRMFEFPEWELPVQSIPSFRECTYLINFRQYIVLFFMQKIAAVTMLMVVFAFFVPLFRNSQLVYFFMIVITALEYAFYKLLYPSSYLNILKFLNVFYLFSPANFFTEYQNLNFFGLALGIGPFLLAFWVVTVVTLTFLYCRFSVKRPELSVNFKVFHLPVHPERGTASLMKQEGWRVLFSGRGIVVWVLAVFLAVSWYQDFPEPAMNQEEAGYRKYVSEFGGRLTPEKMDQIGAIEKQYNKIGSLYSELAETYQKGKITAEEYQEQKIAISTLEQSQSGFQKFLEQYYNLQMLQMQGLETSILDEPSLDFLFKHRTRDFLAGMITILLLMMTIIPMGRTGEDMDCLIRSTPKGRLGLFSCRVGYTILFSLTMLLGKWLPILLFFLRQYSIADWGAALQHVRIYLNWLGSMRIGQFLCLWLGMQVLAILVYGMWFFALSQFQSRTSVTALTCIAVVFFTMAAFWSEIPGICYLNPAEAFAPVPMQLLTHWPVYLTALITELAAAAGIGIRKTVSYP